MAGTQTVALRGEMVGPTVIGNGPPESDTYRFTLTHSISGAVITVEWHKIWWIDAYPHRPGNTPEGRVPKKLGEREIWVEEEREAGLIAEFLNGPIASSSNVPDSPDVAGWFGPEMNYAGPQGTSYPPCLCPR